MPGTSQAQAAPFAAAELARALDRDTRCVLQRCSVRDAGWNSVLVRVSQRSDPSGRADLGALPHPRIMLVTRGRAAVRRRVGPVTQPAQLYPGAAWLIPAGATVTYDWTRADVGLREMTLMILPAAELTRTATLMSGPPTWPDAVLAEDPVVRNVVTGVTRAMTTGADELYAESAAAFLAAHLLANYAAGEPGPAVAGRDDARVRTAIEYMADNLHLPVTLAGIADSASLSPYHFLRVFKTATGVPPRRFLTQMRVDAARRRLTDTDLPVTEIAQLCGFSSASQFSTAFRRETGLAPRAFRSSRRRARG